MARLTSLDDVVAELNRQHEVDQETVANNLILALYPLWRIMDFEELDESSQWWLAATLPQIRTAYLQSQTLAAAHAANVRFATLPTAEPIPLRTNPVELPLGVRHDHFELPGFGSDSLGDVVELDFPAMDDVATSLMIEGPWAIKRKMPVDEKTAMDAALVNTSGAAVRQSLKGARNVTHNVLKFDRKVLGYARFTDSDPCYFCAILASRGAVYSRDSFVDSDAHFRANPDATDVPSDFVKVSRVHNNCKCTLRPVYAKSQAMDADALFYKQQWDAAGDVDSFRRNYVPFERKPAVIADLQQQLQERQDALLEAGFDVMSPQVQWASRTQTLLA